MNAVRILPNQTEADVLLVFSITPRCFQQIEDVLKQRETGAEALEFLRDCFSADHYLMTLFTARATGLPGLNIYCGRGVFTCMMTEDENAFLLNSFHEETPQDICRSVHSGINVVAEYGTLLHVTINSPRTYKLHYLRGEETGYELVKDSECDTDRLFSLLKEAGQQLENRRRELIGNRGSISSERISDAFEEYLSLAESYAQFEDESSAAAAKASAGISCYDPMPPESYDRLDRLEYAYAVSGEFDEAVYKVNTKVDVEKEDGTVLSAVITGFGDRNGVRTVILLFDRIVDADELPEIAVVRLSYSRIMYDIQQGVIDDLRARRTRASFLDRCVGQHAPAPYQMKDLSALEYRLNHPPKGEFPPNPSQMEAIKKGISTNDILLVQGPPGTGKTTVILEWVKYFCRECNYRVLISSQNNKAVDNVLERIAQEDGIEAIRAGNETKVQKNLYPLLLERRSSSFRQGVSDSISENENSLRKALTWLKQQYDGPLRRLSEKRKRHDSLRKKYGEKCRRITAAASECSALYGRTYESLQRNLRDAADEIRAVLADESSSGAMLQEKQDAYRKICEEMHRNTERYIDGISHVIDCILEEKPYQTGREIREISSDLMRTAEQILPADSSVVPFACTDGVSKPDSLFSGNALKNCLEKWKACIDSLPQLTDLLQTWKKLIQSQNYVLSEALLESVNLVGATCIGIQSQKKFADLSFDVTIIDEAGQIQIHNALVPMSRSPKLIMLGDHKQIPPVVNDYVVERCEEEGIDPRLEKISLFEDLFIHLPETNKVLLDTQFRMPGEIADILSEWFYDGKYLSFSGKRGMQSLIPGLFHAPFVIVDTGSETDRREHKTTGYTNPCEAALITGLIRIMTGFEHIAPSRIGVISPYGDQVKLLVSGLRSIPEIGADASEVAATLDSFQGQERDIILYSSTRSNSRPPSAKGRIGFLTELRRLNVALSRPKKMLIFIGDMEFLGSCEYGEGEGSPKEFSAFIQLMCRRVREGKGEYITAAALKKRMEEIA